MIYGKPPLSIDQQIDLLASRGMAIQDHARAARYLAHINYYRLRAYWLPFEETTASGNHRFRPGVTFDDALNLYLFDRKFRLLVLEAIERVEVSFRSRFAHVLSLRYGSHVCLDPTPFRSRFKYQQYLESLRKEIDRSQETFIAHYRSRYTTPEIPPVWATCEVMSFGLLSKWLDNLKHRQDRQAIASGYGLDETVLVSFMHHLTPVRNLTAHHCRLWNRRLTMVMSLPRRPAYLTAWFNLNPGIEHYIYNTLVMLGYLLKVISPGTTWPVRVRDLLDSYPDTPPKSMGFPENWSEMSLWQGDV